MPAPARISVPVKQATPLKPASTITPKTPASMPRPKARVVHRRRARGRLDDTDTDEELVREPHSDDDSDSASSILDSESETVSESEPEPDRQDVARLLSQSHTPLVNGAASGSSPSPPADKPAAFPQSVNWSEMVAEENANGAADLPVIDFAELSSHTHGPSEVPAPAPSPPPNLAQEKGLHDVSPPQAPSRKPGQSARQAYRTRLDTDPAYVPTLGQFWSHDDRLLDKDLRSLSGWWRGRWQGRGRGRGFSGGWGMRGGRGRGGFSNGTGPFSPGESQMRPEDAPRAERAWTHDGFEEMKKVDEELRNQRAFRGRGAFPRGRGGLRGGFSGRGDFTATSSVSAGPPSESQHSSTSDTLRFGTGTRPWFAMKPERVWTKQFDAYLYFEAPLKPVHNQGLGQGVRVRLPGSKDEDGREIVVRLPLRTARPPQPVLATKEPSGERAFVVKLPHGKSETKERDRVDAFLTPEDIITVAPPPVEDPVPVLSSSPVLPISSVPSVDTRLAKDIQTFTPARPPVRRASEVAAPPTQASMSVQTATETTQQFDFPSTSNDFTAPGPSHLASRAPQETVQPTETIHPQPPIQTTAPPFQQSPPYGSHFGYTQPSLPLPPGIAVSDTGVTYEIATGRAVFLHTPPPPPPPLQMQGTLYNPRPMMPMHHAHHGSVHFLPPPPPHHASISPPGYLGSPPIFALPRQSSRVEIRAPGDKGKEREETERARGAVRSAVNINAEPFTPAAQAPPLGYYGAEGQASFDEAQRHHHLSYQHTPYYYPLGPEGGGQYAYGQYAPADAGQPQHYEQQYAQDTYPQQQQHTGYY